MKPIEPPRSIRDYFAVLPHRRLVRQAAVRAGVQAGPPRFLELMQEKEGTARPGTPASGGLRIRDYRSRPVPRPTAGGAGSPAGGMPVAREGGPFLREAATENTSPKTGARPSPAFRKASAAEREAPAGGEVDPQIEGAIRRAAARHHLAPDLLRAVVQAESNFDPRAVSAKGAMGLMQLMPETARELGVSRPFDIQQNVDGGARYLKRLLERYGGDLRLALAAYNAGPAAVERHEGEVPYAETRTYVRRVLRAAGLG